MKNEGKREKKKKKVRKAEWCGLRNMFGDLKVGISRVG